ncbi:ATP-dependent nuclease [Carnobacterium maltaromaticum]|uniref:ATP-dependent nuclease n=1 Tax=Carnobacterium maltaromaticum TaxID=2751 RepID=UPI0039BE5672
MALLKIKLKNYKKIKNSEILFNEKRNIFVGENGVGKSSILTAISQVLSGSYSNIETLGFQSLFNSDIISEFMESDRKYEDLPLLSVELYINEGIENHLINGIHNSDNQVVNGLKMIIIPNDDLSTEIKESLVKTEIFPFEFYKLDFRTFSDKSYNSYAKYKGFIKYTLLDSTKISSNYAIKDYISRIYVSQSDVGKRQLINNAYRDTTHIFSEKLYEEYNLNHSPDEYKVVLNSQGEESFKENITVQKNGIDIKNMGQGEKIFINTDFSLTNAPEDVSIVLIEEPENHLSYVNMHKLIDKITATSDKQTFVTTHSNMITSRLDLNNAIFISEDNHTNLSSLSKDTANFFKKSPDTSVLNFILAKKSILVEGDAEYILLDDFYKNTYDTDMYLDNITLISCGGKTFKRYIELAQILKKKTSIITDNDKDFTNNITENYKDVISDNICVFSDTNNDLYTFEVALYYDNENFFESNIKSSNMRNGVLSFMLDNKAEAAFRLLKVINDEENKHYDNFVIPKYIKDAFEWIRLL